MASTDEATVALYFVAVGRQQHAYSMADIVISARDAWEKLSLSPNLEYRCPTPPTISKPGANKKLDGFRAPEVVIAYVGDNAAEALNKLQAGKFEPDYYAVQHSIDDIKKKFGYSSN